MRFYIWFKYRYYSNNLIIWILDLKYDRYDYFAYYRIISVISKKQYILQQFMG